MSVLVWIVAITVLNGVLALVGAVFLGLGKRRLQMVLPLLIAFSAGALLSGAFFHMLAEALETMEVSNTLNLLVSGFVTFFLVERFLHWHHCYRKPCDVRPVSYLMLMGDSVHNFIDGLVIASSFLVNIPFGLVTSVVIMGHELPQEVGDFAVMLYGGMERRRALMLNFLSQLTSVVGGLVGYFITTAFSGLLLPFAAGGFLYISASDLIPELHEEKTLRRSLASLLFFFVGIAFLVWIKTVFNA